MLALGLLLLEQVLAHFSMDMSIQRLVDTLRNDLLSLFRSYLQSFLKTRVANLLLSLIYLVQNRQRMLVIFFFEKGRPFEKFIIDYFINCGHPVAGNKVLLSYRMFTITSLPACIIFIHVLLVLLEKFLTLCRPKKFNNLRYIQKLQSKNKLQAVKVQVREFKCLLFHI